MNKFRKAISVGMSAALLASLFTVIAASSAMAAVTVTSAGNVPQDGTSAGTATFVLTESAINGIATNGPGCVSITIDDATPSAGAVTFSGTAVVSAPGSLGASATYAGNILTICWTNSDLANIESITVSGLHIDATATASPGAITATLAAVSGNGSVAAFQAGGNASGVLASGTPIGTATATVNVTTTGCAFVNTGIDIDPGPGITTSGSYAFAVGGAGTTAESLAGTATALPPAPAAQQQTLTITTAGGFTSVHNAGDVVTQTNSCAPNGVLGSPGTVVQAITFNNPTPKATVFPGENNSPATPLVIVEPAFGFLAAGTTFTYTIATPGVVFSTAPTVADVNDSDSLANAMVLSAPVLSADRKSATVTVTTASTLTPARITLSNILYDVASTVPAGTFISVGVTTSAGRTVMPATRTNAVVFRGIAAVAATIPTVYIGENGQTAGLISFTESAAGFFTDGTGSNNTFTICPNGVNYVFTTAPWAKVTGGVAAGNLILREGATASPDNLVMGTQLGNCYYWTVWTKSTTPSTIQIGNADVTTGPLINVSVNQAPGPVLVDLFIGSSALSTQLAATVQFATATFRNQVTVTALAQPFIPVGSNGSPAGDIQIQETATGQLKAGERICVEILPNQQAGTLYDAFLKGLNTADVPVVTASNGVVVGPVLMGAPGQLCSGALTGAPSMTLVLSFSFVVQQQSTTGTGKLVVSNIKYATVNDAVTGPVQVNVYGFGGTPTSVVFQSLISNARIGTSSISGSNTTRLGVTQTGAFTISTKVAKVGKYVTYRFDFGVAAAGKVFLITGATKTGNDWSAFTTVTSRRANASGVVYYYIRQYSATWKSYRAAWTESGVITLARQSRWIP